MIALPSGFYAVINESGTHIHKGFLKVRVDIYPPVGSKTYPLYYVDHFDREPTEAELADEALLALVPTHKELNPILCHFIRINPETTKTELEDIIKQTFDTATLQQLDNFQGDQKRPDRERLGKVGQLMNTPAKCGSGRQLTLSGDAQAILINQINTSFKEVIV